MLNITSSRSSPGVDPFRLLPKSKNRSGPPPAFLPPSSPPEPRHNSRPISNKTALQNKSPRRFTIQFVSLYGTNLEKEMDSMMRSFKFFTKDTPEIVIEQIFEDSNQTPDLYIVMDKEPLHDSIQILKALSDKVVVDNAGAFRNVVMIYISSSAGDRVCTGVNRVNTTFPELPMYYVEFNTVKRIKFCPDNDKVIQEIMERLVARPRVQNARLPNGNRNSLRPNAFRSQSTSGSILTESRIAKMGIANTTLEEDIPGMDTSSIALSKINDLYYALRPKDPANSLYIKKERVQALVKSAYYKSLEVVPRLYARLLRSGLCPGLFIEPREILYVDVDAVSNANQVKLTQKSMKEHGSGFAEYYQMKKGEFKSNRMKKYLIAMDYIQNLSHRNGELTKRSSLFPSQEIVEFQNAFYLGFDVEYLYTHRLKEQIARRGSRNFTYILPLVAKYQNEPRNENSNSKERYILYYLLFMRGKAYLYEILNMEEDRKLVEQVNQKMDTYMSYIFSTSFLAAKPFAIEYQGIVQRDLRLNFRLNFLSDNILSQLYSQLHLFYLLINPTTGLKEILGEDPTKQMSSFIIYLLEMEGGENQKNNRRIE